jgi:citrate lyase beta subunit
MRTFKSITSALYVPGNQERMLLKCTQVGASLIVPDLEDAVPILEKPKAL